jgi:peptidoglycan hydrolase-like protein with peptidoglycan-binding domain
MNKWTTRSAVAVVATGILATGLTACGSDGDSGANAAAGKPAGTKSVLHQDKLPAPSDSEQIGVQAAGNIGPGARGYKVKCVQWGVNPYIPRSMRLVVDGSFGTKTYKAVKHYQAKRGLSADGIVGPRTGARIQRDIQITYNSLRRDRDYAHARPYGNWLSNCSRYIPG